MKYALCLGLLATSLFALPLGHSAMAQSLGEVGIGGAIVGSGALYMNSSKNKANEHMAIERLKYMGLRDIKKVPDQDNQYFVTEKNGERYKVTLDPVTGNMISALPQ